MRARFDAAGLARVRLGVSPAAEVSAWLGLTARGGRHPVFGDPGAAARAALTEPDAALVAAVLPAPGRPAYTPDLLTPKPGAAGDVLGEQLDRIAATPAETVAEQVGYTGLRVPPSVREAVERGTFATSAATGLRRFWTAAVADGWSRLRALMDADLAERARTMATRGVGAMFDSLHPALSWDEGTLSISGAWEEEYSMSGIEVVCVPAVLAWPTLSVQFCQPADAVLAYPAAGIGARGTEPASRSVDKLVGPSRAELLRDLDVPRSTAALARRHHLAAATVSYHLKVLERAGLVAARRDGRFVLYHATEAGCALSQRQIALHGDD